MKLSAKRCEVLASTIARRLTTEGFASDVGVGILASKLSEALIDDIALEDRINDEVRDLLDQHADEMKATGADYHEAFRRAKAMLVRKRNLIL